MPIESLQPESQRKEWLELISRTSTADVHLHPDVVEVTARNGLVHRQWTGASELSSLAVLAPKSVRLVKLKGLGRSAELSGYRVVSDRLLGRDDDQALRDFALECASLLETGKADCIYFDDLETHSPLWKHAHDIAAERGLITIAPSGVQPHWWIRFPDPPADYWSEFSGKTRNTLKRKAKKLPHQVVCVERADQVEDFLARAHAISENTWQTRRLGLRIRNDRDERALFQRLADAGALRCYLLHHESGEPLAFMVGVQHGDVFVYEEVGYDTEYSRRSPGTVLLYRVLQDLHERRPVRLFDFGTGHAGYKEMFGNHMTESGPLVLVARRLRPAMTVRLEQARRTADQAARQLLHKTGVYDKLRQRYRRQ